MLRTAILGTDSYAFESIRMFPSIDISVVVPVYNTEDHLEACIQGLLSQQFSGSSEYILVDNNSTDGSAEIIKRHPSVRLLSQPKQGSYAARNLGLSQARGQIIAFTDSDCVPRPNWLEQIVHSMQNRQVEIVLGRREFHGRSPWVHLLELYESHKARYIFGGTDREVFYAYTNNMAVRRSLLDAVGPFVETSRGGDVIFIRRAVDRFSCELVRYAPDVVVRHLEITNIWNWYKKMYIYGRSFQNYRKIVAARPLSNAQRLEVLKKMTSAGDLSWLDSAELLAVLSGGIISWQVGRLSGFPWSGK